MLSDFSDLESGNYCIDVIIIVVFDVIVSVCVCIVDVLMQMNTERSPACNIKKKILLGLCVCVIAYKTMLSETRHTFLVSLPSISGPGNSHLHSNFIDNIFTRLMSMEHEFRLEQEALRRAVEDKEARISAQARHIAALDSANTQLIRTIASLTSRYRHTQKLCPIWLSFSSDNKKPLDVGVLSFENN